MALIDIISFIRHNDFGGVPVVIYTKEPVFSPEGAADEFRSLMNHPPQNGLLRAFTLRVDPRPDIGSFFRLAELAADNCFSFRMGEAIYSYGPAGHVHEFTVAFFFNQKAPV